MDPQEAYAEWKKGNPCVTPFSFENIVNETLKIDKIT